MLHTAIFLSDPIANVQPLKRLIVMNDTRSTKLI